MKRKIFISGLLITVVIILSSQVTAQEGKINFGNLKIIPGLTLKGVYDDNIYLGNGTNQANEIEESDWITHVMPALLFNYSLQERGSVSLGYSGDLAFYSDSDYSDNDWQNHKGALAVDYKSPGGLILFANNTYIDAEDPYSNLEQYRIGLMTKRWDNDLKTKVGFDFGNRFRILTYYNFYKQDYELDRDYTQDYDQNEFGVGFQMRFLPKTWGFIRYHMGERDYFTYLAGTGVTDSNDSDFQWQRVNAGLTWDPGAKVSGELNVGYQWKEYDNETDVNGDQYEDQDTWIAGTLITYKATPSTALVLSATRALRQTGSNDNEYFTDTGIGINLQQKIL
ncbi:MAG TPA: outer membrane beta-barrel protein, partial [Desulfatiglandales bacterium]|nr:outer membrane beta-barrel protein [Desulfatiglandales bacterium]